MSEIIQIINDLALGSQNAVAIFNEREAKFIQDMKAMLDQGRIKADSDISEKQQNWLHILRKKITV